MGINWNLEPFKSEALVLANCNAYVRTLLFSRFNSDMVPQNNILSGYGGKKKYYYHKFNYFSFFNCVCALVSRLVFQEGTMQGISVASAF